jgi:hypothetical protein
MASLREQSTSTLAAAIRGNTQDAKAAAEILRRANVCLANYYDPDLDPETKAGVRASFVGALRDKPLWAVIRAFEAWSRTMTRRPSPAEIVILADRELKPIADELRRRDEAKRDEEAWKREEQRRVPTPEEANAITAAAGFTPARMDAIRKAPMALTFAEAEARQEDTSARHWSDAADPDGPEWRALRAARAANPIIREMQARKAAGGDA